MTFQQIISLLISFIIGPISARFLQPENYGLLSYGNTIVVLLSALALLGINSVLVRELIANPMKTKELLGTAFALRLTASIVCFFISIICVVILQPDNKLLWIIVAIQATVLLFQVYDVFVAWFQTQLKMKYVSIALIIVKLVTALWQIVILSFHTSVVFFAMTSSIGSFIGCILIYYFFRKSNTHFKWTFSQAKYLLGKSYHFIVSNLAVVIYMQIDKIMIAEMLNYSSAGVYEVATNLATIWQFIPIAIIDSARTVVLEKKSENNDEYYKYLKMSMNLITILCVLICLVFVFGGSYIVYLLYGEEYVDAAPSLKILVWATMISMLGCVRSIWILGDELGKYDKYFTVSAAILNVILNYILIYKMGIIGAAVSTLISYFYEVFIAPLLFKETRKFIPLYISSFKELPNILKVLKKDK